jgi:hypothetical protein
MPRSPWRRIRLASIAGELAARSARLGFANLRRLAGIDAGPFRVGMSTGSIFPQVSASLAQCDASIDRFPAAKPLLCPAGDDHI